MTDAYSKLSRPLAAAACFPPPPVRARRGSVLILVVALLVLMALIGTAFITTASSDRDSSLQHGYNTQVDLLLDGIKQLCIAQLSVKVAGTDLSNASGKTGFRSATPGQPVLAAYTVYPNVALTQIPFYFTNVDFAGWDSYLGDRFPSRNPAATTAEPAIWNYISANPLASRAPTQNPNLLYTQSTTPQFSSPLANVSGVAPYATSRAKLTPTSVAITLHGVTQYYPAFRIGDQNDPNFGQIILAADADGDGQPDAGLFELPINQINGIKYYAAIRIIDNSAAINASTAWSNVALNPSVPAAELNLLPIDATPVNVEMRGLMEATDPGKFDAVFNPYRWGDIAPFKSQAIRDDTRAPDTTFNFATRYDEFWTMLGSRLDNPGYVTGAQNFRALGLGESTALAYRFCLRNPYGSGSVMEQSFPNATGANSFYVNRKPYAPTDTATWFANIFDYDSLISNPAAIPMRSLFVGSNGTSNFVPAFDDDIGGGLVPELRLGQYRYRGQWAANVTYQIGDWVRFNGFSYVAHVAHSGQQPPVVSIPPVAGGTGGLFWAEVPWGNHPVKINVNTANFGSLKAAYYAIMADGPENKPGGISDVAYNDAADPIYTFGDVFRPPLVTTRLPRYIKQLRAALAAVNTIDLRDQDNDVTSRTVLLTDDNGGAGIKAMVYGTERQPYITESMVHITKENAKYVAIELFNPYPVPISLSAFSLLYRDRTALAAPVLISSLKGLLPGDTIPANGYVYIASNSSRPPGTDFPAGAAVAVVNALDQVIDNGTRELLLMRTRRYDGTQTSSADPSNTFNESNTSDLVPADGLEFMGMAPGLNNTVVDPAGNIIPVPDRYHYRRATLNDPNNFVNAWHCVYGGPYNRTPAAEERRQRGWVRDLRPSPPTSTLERTTPPGWGPKTRLTADIPQNDFNGAPQTATFRTRSMQVNNEGMPGPWKPFSTGVGAGAPTYPFGGFTRIGDILDVTFVGGYRIGNDPNSAEINSISMDSAFADDGDRTDDDTANGTGAGYPLEQLGRFCPIFLTPNGVFDDLTNRPNLITPAANQRYAWATDLFEYLTVICPQDDYMANVDPGLTAANQSGDPTALGSSLKWPFTQFPEPVPNGLAVTNTLNANHGREDAASVQGLINVNTANWFVLSSLPFTTSYANNQAVARAIVAYREANGPFRSLFDLLKVDLIRNTYPPNPGLADGDVSPLAGNTAGNTDDQIIGDFEARYLMINRVSNLVSFRSDSFTVYVLVQGWRNAGTAVPELVVQRRAAMIVDRSSVVPLIDKAAANTNLPVASPSITTVPNN